MRTSMKKHTWYTNEKSFARFGLKSPDILIDGDADYYCCYLSFSQKETTVDLVHFVAPTGRTKTKIQIMRLTSFGLPAGTPHGYTHLPLHLGDKLYLP